MNNGSGMRANPFYLRTQMIQTVQMPAGSSELRRLCGLRGSPCVSRLGPPLQFLLISFHFGQIQFQMNIEFLTIKEELENLRFGSAQSLTFKETEF